MTDEILTKAIKLKETISNIGMLSEMLTKEYPDAILDLRSQDKTCSYRRISINKLPDELINEVQNVINKHYETVLKEYENL